jgi:RNA polymerase primary sigma factor
MEFKDRLAAALAVDGSTKGGLAGRIGQSPSALSNWLSGRVPNPEIVAQLAEALDVPRRWLADGEGPMPKQLQERELASLKKVRWAPRRVPVDGARTGGNAALFAISPTLEIVLREAIQNPLDVRLPGGPVTVDVRLLGLTGQARAAFLRAMRWPTVFKHLQASVHDADAQQISNALREGLEIDRGGELLVLLVSDYNAQGLTGPETRSGNFAALTRDTLFSDKGGSTTAGGSHGIGSFTAVRASAANTVLYYSDLSEPEGGHQRGRLLGRCELTWHRDPDAPDDEVRECDGPMWLGSTDGPDAVKADSHWAGDGDLLVQDLRLLRDRAGAPGTTVAIVGLRDLGSDRRRTPSEMVEALADEAARSFFGALDHGTLEINVDYLQIDAVTSEPNPPPGQAARVRPEQSRMSAPLVSALKAHRDETVVDELVDSGDVVRVRVPLTVPALRDGSQPEFVHEAILLVRRATFDEIEDAQEAIGQVVRMRGPRMRISALDANRTVFGAHPFQAVLLAGNAAGDSEEDARAEAFLRLAEPPAHDRWELTESLRQLYRTGAGARLADFDRAVKQAVRDIVVHEVDPPSDGPRDLSRRFKFGEPPVAPERAPRLLIDEQAILADGAWQIRGTLRVKSDPTKPLHGTPRLVFAGETGKRSKVSWRDIIPISNCEVDAETMVLTVPAGKRSARFTAITDPSSHPVDSEDVAVRVTFHVQEHS